MSKIWNWSVLLKEFLNLSDQVLIVRFMCIILITYEKSKGKINFLDVVIKIKEGRMITDHYCKPTDGHQYLHYHSCHC